MAAAGATAATAATRQTPACVDPEPATGGQPIAVVACGALSSDLRAIGRRRGWHLEVHSLSALLHDRPSKIAPAVAELARRLQAEGKTVVVAYADCGTYGALDAACAELGLPRLPGLHCYDVLAGPDRVAQLLAAEPGTYLLTDFLVRSFRRAVVQELGLDRHPELLADYFGNYRRVAWLAQHRSPELESEAREIAALLGLPLVTVDVGISALEAELEALMAPSAGRVRPEDAEVPGVASSRGE
jgi:hypothetical protein